MLLKNFILFVHILFILFFEFLAPYIIYFYTKNKCQNFKYYLWGVFFVVLHWALLKNECILSYFEHKLDNPNYKMGDDPFKQESYEIIGKYLFGFTEQQTRYLFTCFIVISILFSVGYVRTICR